MRWEVVRVVAWCAFGCRIPKGEVAAFGKRRFVLCKKHASGYSMAPPRGLKKRDAADREASANAIDPKLRQMPSGD
jgi:hypothetical protein